MFVDLSLEIEGDKLKAILDGADFASLGHLGTHFDTMVGEVFEGSNRSSLPCCGRGLKKGGDNG